jgi:hypothetical protein
MIAWFLTAALSLSVSPQMAFAPATVRARVTVDVGPTARILAVALVSSGYEQTSEIPLVPRDGRQTVWLAPWLHVPAGDYVVAVIVTDQAGAVLARQTSTNSHSAGARRPMTPSNFRRALASRREGFLLTVPRALMWHGDRHFVDDVLVSERVYQLAYEGRLVDAREAWLQEWDAAAAAFGATARLTLKEMV